MKISLVFLVVYISYVTASTNLGIINGQEAKEGQFPYQVSIQYCLHFFNIWSCDHMCGGTIISPNWILTAGHCYVVGEELKVVAGIYKLNDRSTLKQFMSVERGIVHENYAGQVGPNDIALLELSKPLTLSETVKVIKLPTLNLVTDGPAVVSGWGQTNEDDGGFPDMPNVMQYADISIYSEKDCLENFRTALEPQPNRYNITANVCTIDNQNKGICGGDSGTPLVQNGTLIGLGSWVISPCGTKGALSAYTRISNYIPWISNHTGIIF